MTNNDLLVKPSESSPRIESIYWLWAAHHMPRTPHWMALSVEWRTWWTHERGTATNEAVGSARTELWTERRTRTAWSTELRSVAGWRAERPAASWSVIRRTRWVLRWRWEARRRRRTWSGRRWAWRSGRCRILRCIWTGGRTLKTVRLHVAGRWSLVRRHAEVWVVRADTEAVAGILCITALAVALPIVSRFIHAQWRSGRHATAWNTYKHNAALSKCTTSLSAVTYLTCFQYSEFLLFLCASH